MIKGRQQAGERPKVARKTRKARGSQRSLAAHPVFVPLLALWGAALGGLIVLVLPHFALTGMAAQSGAALPLGLFQPALAGLAAIVTGGLCLALAAALRQHALSRAAGPSIAEMAARRVRPIDPVRDLGTDSLDTPLDLPPLELAGELPEPRPVQPSATPSGNRKPMFTLRDFEDALIETCEAVAEDTRWDNPAGTPPAAPPPVAPDPVALDLAQFAQIPGRNAVWVDELPVPSGKAGTESAPRLAPRSALRAVPPRPQPNVVEQLRAVAPSELSLVQMVERLAAALHERQARPGTLPAGRDAALAEALKALAILANDSGGKGAHGAQPNGETLRDALSRLQDLRGAA